MEESNDYEPIENRYKVSYELDGKTIEVGNSAYIIIRSEVDMDKGSPKGFDFLRESYQPISSLLLLEVVHSAFAFYMHQDKNPLTVYPERKSNGPLKVEGGDFPESYDFWTIFHLSSRQDIEGSESMWVTPNFAYNHVQLESDRDLVGSILMVFIEDLLDRTVSGLLGPRIPSNKQLDRLWNQEKTAKKVPTIKIEPQECLNCGSFREVDERYIVEKCKNCGDDEYFYFRGYKPDNES